MSALPQLAPALLHVLLVGSHEEDFFLIREILGRNHAFLSGDLDHARSIDEAKEMLRRGGYGLVLFQHEMGDGAAANLLSEFGHAGGTTPFIILTENADEKAVAEIIQSGAYDYLDRAQLTGANLVRTHPLRATAAIESTTAASGRAVGAQAVLRGGTLGRHDSGDQR